ncbi:MAG: hypothetical protein DRP62_07330, partial [Planctomycetota bacterium]
MGLKDLWSRANGWLRTRKLFAAKDYQPDVDDEGLISPDTDSAEPDVEKQPEKNNKVVVKTVQPDSKQSL